MEFKVSTSIYIYLWITLLYFIFKKDFSKKNCNYLEFNNKRSSHSFHFQFNKNSTLHLFHSFYQNIIIFILVHFISNQNKVHHIQQNNNTILAP